MANRRYFETLPGYVDWLHRFFAFQSEAEEWLTGCHADSVIRDWRERRRAALAKADLETLGAAEKALAGCEALVEKL